MKQGFIKTAAATPRITVADCRANGEEILRLIRKMAKEHAKLMVFPELCITGYTCQDLFLQRRLLESAKDTLLWLARETKETDALIWVGLPVCFEGKLYNAAAALNRGKILGIVPKVHLPNYGEFYEQRHFARGNENVSYLELGGEEIPFGTNLIFYSQEPAEFTVAAEICEDLWVPAPPSVGHAVAGAHIIVNLSASNE